MKRHARPAPALLAPALLAAAGLLAAGCAGMGSGPAVEPAADRIFLGEVVTVDAEGSLAGGVGVKDGRILVVGTQDDVLAHRGGETEVVDLEDGALLPGFIDAHSHFTLHALPMTGWVNVSRPPVGGVEDIPGLVAALEAHVAERDPAPGEWIIGYGYEKEALAEGRELTRDDLDPHFPDHPVALLHVSGHGAVLNSAALAAVRIDAQTPTPAGGIIVRKPGTSEPAGLIMEMAFFRAAQLLERPGLAETLAAVQSAQEHYASNGYTTIQDGLTSSQLLWVLQKASKERRLFLDVVALPDWTAFRALLDEPELSWGGPYERHLKIGGVKAVIDGSPQGRTAFFTEPYLVPGPDGQKDWHGGDPNLSQGDIDDIVRTAYHRGIQVYVHANGDAAIDMFLAAHAAAGAPEGRRPVVVHSQFARADQLNAYARIGAVPSFFTNHAFFWGDVHVANLGAERAAGLSPLRSARARKIRFTNHSDYAVTPLDPMFMLWTASERQSRSGKVIGPEERVGVAEALRALTIDAAYQYFEEDDKGSIEPGKLADLVVLDRNPLTTPGDELREIRVLQTIKEGETVWEVEDSLYEGEVE